MARRAAAGGVTASAGLDANSLAAADCISGAEVTGAALRGVDFAFVSGLGAAALVAGAFIVVGVVVVVFFTGIGRAVGVFWIFGFAVARRVATGGRDTEGLAPALATGLALAAVFTTAFVFGLAVVRLPAVFFATTLAGRETFFLAAGLRSATGFAADFFGATFFFVDCAFFLTTVITSLALVLHAPRWNLLPDHLGLCHEKRRKIIIFRGQYKLQSRLPRAFTWSIRFASIRGQRIRADQEG